MESMAKAGAAIAATGTAAAPFTKAAFVTVRMRETAMLAYTRR